MPTKAARQLSAAAGFVTSCALVSRNRALDFLTQIAKSNLERLERGPQPLEKIAA
jgi:hypothetical protein